MEENKKHSSEDILEIIVAIALGITALLTAWATWIGSLHGGNQATNYAKSTNLTAEGNSLWNEASEKYLNDLNTWNRINDINVEIAYAQAQGDSITEEKYSWKLQQIVNDNLSDEFLEAVNWALEQEESVTPFDMEGYYDSYFEESRDIIAQADEVLKQGQQDNANGDRFGLVTVFYSVVMFLLGIVNTFKVMRNKYIVVGISAVCFVVATIIMFTIPMPTGFSFASFFA